jgi:Lon protease-like protein
MIPLPTTLRIFPLGEVVLFPDTLLPLHVFEPRYRALVVDALATDRLIGMVLIRGADGPVPPAQPDTPDRPEIYAVGCAGRIVEHEALDDGRRLVVLRGLTKFRVRRELEDASTLYRSVEAQALYEAPVPAEHMRAWRDRLRGLLGEYVGTIAASGRSEVDRVFEKLDLEGLVNYLSASMPFPVVEKQGLLECPTVERRFERLCDVLRFRVAEAKLGLNAARRADS